MPVHLKYLESSDSIKQFRYDLDFLLKYYKPITLIEIKRHISEYGKIPENRFYVSFDDGLKCNSEVISPVLLEKGIPACFFINTGFVDNMDMSYKYKESVIIDLLRNSKSTLRTEVIKLMKSSPERLEVDILILPYKERSILQEIANILEYDFNVYLKDNEPYMNTNDIRKLISQGFEIGSHSIDHAFFAELNDSEKIEQIKESFGFLKEKFDINYKLFAYPFSEYGVSEKFISELYRNNTVDFLFSTSGMMKDKFVNNISRISMESNSVSGINLLKTKMSKSIIRNLLGSNYIKRNK